MITLASDFGSPYPAAMKGVILQETDTRLVDVTHDLPRQDVRAAAFWCRETIPYFPPAVHLVVVDPGVGTDRDAIVIRVDNHVLIGPDNGVLRPVARRLSEHASDRLPRQDDRLEYFRYDYTEPQSATFHGRDVFAPAAAVIHDHGIASLETLDAVTSISATATVQCEFPSATINADSATAEGEVLVTDDFGNVITNIPGSFLTGRTGEMGTVGTTTARVTSTFTGVDTGEPLLTIGSHGFVECDVNHGRGTEAFELTTEDTVQITF